MSREEEDFKIESIKQISLLKEQGNSDESLIKNFDIDRAVLYAAGISPSYLVPKKEPQKFNDVDDWLCHIPNEGKFELWDGMPFMDSYSRDALTIALIYNMGLKHLVELLNKESIDELKEIILE